MTAMTDQDPRALLRPIDYRWRLSQDPEARRKFELALMKSFEGLGACILDNLPFASLISDAALLRRRLFALAREQKEQYTAKSLMHPGYLPLYIEQYGDLPTQERELWTFMRVLEGREGEREHFTRANIFPDELPGFAEVYPAYLDELEKVSYAILETVAAHYGKEAHFFEPMLRDGSRICRVAHYPRPDRPLKSPRIVPHRDFDFITIIVNIDGPGLELAAHDVRKWLPVEPGPQEIFVLAGEMLDYAVNNRIPAGLHRVSGERGLEKSRYSTPCFFTGNDVGAIRRIDDAVSNSYLDDNPAIAHMNPLQFYDHRSKGFRNADTDHFNDWPLI